VAGESAIHAKVFAERHGAGKSFDSYKKLVEEPSLDAVFVASPNNEHALNTIAALRARKHVFCEKPMALSLAEGARIKDAVAKSGRKLGVGFHLRAHSAIQRAKEIIKIGRLGTLLLIETDWSTGRIGEDKLPALPRHMRWREDPKKSGGGTIMARGVHLFDLIRFLTGEEIVEIAGYTDQGVEASVERTAVGVMKMRGGAFGKIVSSKRLPYARNEIVVHGTKGRFILSRALNPGEAADLEVFEGKKYSAEKFAPEDLYKKELELFRRAVAGEKIRTLAAVDDGIAAIRIAESFFRSARTGKSVIVQGG